MNNRILMTGCALLAACAASAMPTKKELAAAKQLVADITASELEALKQKKKTPNDVGDFHMQQMKSAANEAERFHLLQGAFKLYARGKDYDSAAEALAAMNREIKNLPPEIVVELVQKEMRRVAGERAPKVLAIFNSARRIIKFRKELPRLEKAAKASPKDAGLQIKLAECYAELGKWPEALSAFAKSGKECAKIAKDELDGKVPLQTLADFWWDYGDHDDDEEISVYRMHAAELYRSALMDGSFAGLRKTRAEMRVSQVEKHLEGGLAMESDTGTVAGGKDVSNDGRKAPIAFKIDGTEFNMLACKPGKFKFSLDFKKPERKITITRNYWMGATPVTYEQWWSVMTPDKSKRKPIYKGGEKAPVTMVSREDIEKFCKELTRRNKRYLPGGYEFRLPTTAEWEWAGRSGREIPKIDYTKPYDPKTQDPYDVAFYFGPQQEGTYDNALKPIGLEMAPTFKLPTIYEIFPLNGYHRHTDWCTSMLTPFPVAKFKANKWGFYDMIGNAAELMADMLPHVKTSYPSKLVLWIGDLGQFHAIKRYQSALDQELKDPYFICRGNQPQKISYNILRGLPLVEGFDKYPDETKFPKGFGWNGTTWIWFRQSHEPLGPICSFRLCIGPKLKSTYVD